VHLAHRRFLHRLRAHLPACGELCTRRMRSTILKPSDLSREWILLMEAVCFEAVD
jgi:hypothetical protein